MFVGQISKLVVHNETSRAVRFTLQEKILI